MDRRRFISASGSIAAAGLVAGCVGDSSSDDGESGDGVNGPITIGALEPTSGNFTPWGKAHLAGLEYGVEEINADGGVMGADLELVTEDTESDPTAATNSFRQMVERDDITAATGPVSSDVGIQTSQVAQEVEVPMLLHMSGSTEAITPETRHTFRVGLHPALSFIRAQAQIIEDNGYENVAAITAEYAWGNSVQESIKSEIPVDVDIQTTSLGTSDFRPLIRQFPDDIEMVIATGHPPGTISISSQMAGLNVTPEVTTGPSIPPGVLWNALGETTVEVGQTHVHITDVYSSAFSDVASAYNEERDDRFSTHHGYGYVTAQAVAEAVRQAGTDDPTEVTATIRNTELDTLFPEPLDYANTGEIASQRQLYSQFSPEAPDYAPDGSWSLKEFFRTDPLSAIPADS